MKDTFTLIVPAAGEGCRLGADTSKAFVDLAGEPLVCRTMERFDGVTRITQRIVAVMACDMEAAAEHLSRFDVKIVEGGRLRQDSVRAALSQAECPYVAVHDAARPFISQDVIEQVLDETVRSDAAIVASSVTDTIKRVQDGEIAETVPRSSLRAAQTPQAFRTDLLRKAFEAAEQADLEATDDAQLVEKLGVTVTIVEAQGENMKITTPEDLDRARRFFAATAQEG